MEQKQILRYIVLVAAVLVTGGVLLRFVFSGDFEQKGSQLSTSQKVYPSIASSGHSLSWRAQYNSHGRATKSIDPSGRSKNISYSHLKNGQTQSIAINSLDGNDLTLRYNKDGLLSEMTDSQGKVAYRYDQRGSLMKIERTGTPTIEYEYDEAGRISGMRIGDFYKITRSYDFLGRLSLINTPAGTIKYEYRTGQGMVVRSLPNGVKTYIKRQADGELKEIVHGFFKQPNDNRYTVLANYTYEHGPDGRIVAIGENSAQGQFIRRFTYDLMGRLIHATGQGGQEFSYEYDKLGNRTKATDSGSSEQTCTYDWAGRLVTVNGDSTQYDANSNLAGATIKSAKRNYHYHSDGRVAGVNLDDEAVEYRYDGFGRLLSRSSSAGETSYIPDPLSGVWQPLVIDEGGSKTLVIWDGNTPLALIRDGQVEWLLHDHLGSVRMVTDSNGRVRETYGYDPFGIPLNKQKASTPIPGFAGLFWDEQAGGYLTMARLYNPHLGSFLQPDPQKRIPTADLNDLSLFAYCGGDPVNYVDLNGAEPEAVISVSEIEAMIRLLLIEMKENRFKKGFNLHYPNSILGVFADQQIPGYYKCWEYQRAIYELLTSNPHVIRNWQVIPFAEVQISNNKLEHFFIVIKSRKDGVRYKIDPWRITNSFNININAESKLIPYKWEPFDFDLPKEQWPSTYDLPKEFGHPEWRDDRIRDEILRSQILRYNQLYSEPSSLTVSRRKHEHHKIKTVGGVDRSSIHDVPMERMISTPEDFKVISPSSIGSSYVIGDELENMEKQIRQKKKRDDFVGLQNKIISDGGGGGTGGSGGGPLPLTPPPSTPKVGGVALGGAGALINGIGALKGVQVDENGNLILVGEDDKDIELPPLRLDDLVTVFRSVYINGEGPTVTIDPNPENPEKSAMIIRHSAATDSTYVGWVLYQADRLMKGYGQGVDNITGSDIKSTIPGYDKIIDTVYFGGVDPLQRQRGGVWERFWIVPAEATRFQGDRQKLTLFDVPLKVNTQKMKWVGNELVDDLSGKSSPGANAFTSWFTKNYDGIAEEQYLKPPDETGIEEAVPVFAELQRIALMTAIAEKLRDQGVPMPFWMYDYEVRKIPFEKFTPGLEVKRQKREGSILRTARIFGGVELSAEDKVVKTYSSNSSVSRVAPELKAEIRQNIRLANQLEKTVSDVVSPVAAVPLAVKSVQQDKKAYKVTAVPGANTLALSPCRLSEPDLVIPLPGNRDLHFIRQFNSFFTPRGLWGKGWTLDLPRLQKVRVPFSRESGKTSYTIAYVLLTPLNTIHAYFLSGRAVKNFSNPQSPDIDSNSLFRSLAKAESRFLNSGSGSTLMLRQKSGQEWHFNGAGQLVAVKDGPQITQYEREKGKIIRIVSQHGDTPPAEILLEYDGGKLSKATGKSGAFHSSKTVTVTYSYDDQGLLTGVSTDEGMVGYRYKREKVSAVTWQGTSSDSQPEVIREYEYDARGRLLTEKDGNSTIVYNISNISPRQKGIVFSASSTGMGGDDDEDRIGGKKHAKHAAGSGGGGGDGGSGDSTEVIMHYDQQMRPIKSVDPDGIVTKWSYPDSSNVEMTITNKEKQSITVIDSIDNKNRTIEVNGSPWITAKFNEAGQLARLSDTEDTLLQQSWRADGQLGRIRIGNSTGSLQYDNQGLLNSILLHPSDAGEKLSEWRETSVDAYGRAVEVKDYTGLHIDLHYDKTGGISSVRKKNRNGTDSGIDISRNKKGFVDTVKSSWGSAIYYTYGQDDRLKKIITKRGGQSSSFTFSNGRVGELTSFDGGRTSFSYHNDGSSKGFLASIKCPNGLDLVYDYNADGLLSTVEVGNQRRVRLEYDDQGRVVAYKLEKLVM